MDVIDPRARITQAARRHGVDDEDILHAYRNPAALELQDDGFIMISGPRRDGHFHEVGFRYDPDTGASFVPHAMIARPRYLRPR